MTENNVDVLTVAEYDVELTPMNRLLDFFLVFGTLCRKAVKADNTVGTASSRIGTQERLV